MKIKIYGVILCSSLILFGCTKTDPLLEKNQNYIGEWKSENSTLEIKKNGEIKFSQHLHSEQKNASSDMKSSTISNIKAPLTQLNQQHLHIGEGDLSKDFKINKAPYQQDNEWRLILDGEIYTRH
ncbi:hypothetical protein HX005_02185 [Acinetobacter sp. R933-2]|uniref:hypothetical protein n=1 Tax=Acinetobacter sp. R933-2 TaxID=2746728 RepID=UPI002576C9FC|nr:hypothetical protein [Acinetobacter sp. R933-2]MDM1246206.1 hypothetical protein [Acinetobacter sp. R933-2]